MAYIVREESHPCVAVIRCYALHSGETACVQSMHQLFTYIQFKYEKKYLIIFCLFKRVILS